MIQINPLIKKTMLSEQAKEAKREYQRNYRKNQTPEAKEKKKDYDKRWRQEHPEQVKVYHETYWERKAYKCFEGINNPDKDNYTQFSETMFNSSSGTGNNQDINQVILTLHKSGSSLRAIASYVGFSHSKVKRIIERSKDAES